MGKTIKQQLHKMTLEAVKEVIYQQWMDKDLPALVEANPKIPMKKWIKATFELCKQFGITKKDILKWRKNEK